MKHLCLTVKMIGHGDLKYKNGAVMGISWGYDIASNKIQVCGADTPKIQEYFILAS